jgi:REP element-mobilizing transposase RayT
MPRRPRPLAAGAVYHVTARGNRHAPIFLDDADRARFVRSLARLADRLGWSCLAWCLMTTHYHLLVLTPEPDLAVGMRRLNGDHAQYFNVRHGLDGHVFQGRYHAVLVGDDAQLLTTARYIAVNPVAAGLCADPAGWRWSSHRAALGLEPPVALDRDALHGHFAADGGDGRRRYAEFVGEAATGLTRTPALAPLTAGPATIADALAGSDAATAIRRAYFEAAFSTSEIGAFLGLHRTSVLRRLRRTGPDPVH